VSHIKTVHLKHFSRALSLFATMSVPIPFSDIGKPTRDLLSKDFITNGFKLEAKTTAPNGVVGIVWQSM
jgi:hypothetical protein